MLSKHPYVVGIIGSNLSSSKYVKIQRAFKRLGHVYLPLKVEPKYLKNIILCMKLMDVVGINVSKEYEKKIIPYLDKIDSSSKTAKKVNAVVRQKGKFVGYYVDDIMKLVK